MKLVNLKKKDFIEVNKLATPILASSFAEIIFNVADQTIIGRTSVVGYAAVGIAANLIYILTGTLGILSLAFNILFGKILGSGDKKRAEEVFQTAMTVAILIGVCFEILCLAFGKVFLSKIYGLENEMLGYAYDYLRIAGWGLGLNTIIFIFSAYFKNMRRTEINLKATIISLFCNFVIDYVLVFGKLGFPVLGIKGAAIGTVAGLTIYVLIFIKHFIKIDFIHYKPVIIREWFRKLIKLYIPLLGQDFVESTLFVVIITVIVAQLDIYSIASYSLLESMTSIINLPIFIYAGVALTMVTQNIEKRNVKSIRKYCVVTYLCSLVAVSLIGVVFILFPQEMIKIITNDIKLVKLANGFVALIVIVQILNIANQLFKYCLQGISEEKWVLYFSTVISGISCIIIWGFSVGLGFGLSGIYVGVAISYIALGSGYFIKFIMLLKNYK